MVKMGELYAQINLIKQAFKHMIYNKLWYIHHTVTYYSVAKYSVAQYE